MRVLVTGATGYVGAGVARALVSARHEVVGLCRDERGAARLAAVGVEPLLGDLADAALLERSTRGCDAVVQAGFRRGAYDDLQAAVDLDRASVAALLAGGRPLLYVSGIGVAGGPAGSTAHEDDDPDVPPAMSWRRSLELDVLAADGVVVRPAVVHGRGGGEVPRALVDRAREVGVSRYPLPGDGPWPAVHVDDLGDLVALALSTGTSGVLHGAADESTPAAVAGAVGRRLGVPVEGVPVEVADDVVPFARWLGGRVHVDASRARGLGWRPSRPGFADDVAAGGCG